MFNGKNRVSISATQLLNGKTCKELYSWRLLCSVKFSYQKFTDASHVKLALAGDRFQKTKILHKVFPRCPSNLLAKFRAIRHIEYSIKSEEILA